MSSVSRAILAIWSPSCVIAVFCFVFPVSPIAVKSTAGWGRAVTTSCSFSHASMIVAAIPPMAMAVCIAPSPRRPATPSTVNPWKLRIQSWDLIKIMVGYGNSCRCSFSHKLNLPYSLCHRRKALDHCKTWWVKMNLVSLQKLLISPCFGLFAPSTLFATSSIAGPTAPITINRFKFENWRRKMCLGKVNIVYHNSGCCKRVCTMSFQNRFCHHRRALGYCRTW